MARVLLLCAILVAPAAAQFQDLATSGDGSEVYFSSSLRLRGTNDPLHPKVYRASGAGVSLFAERQQEPLDALSRSNFFQLIAPQLSSDGSVMVLNAQRICSGGSRCVGVQYWEATVMNSGTETRRIAGQVRLSSNGRYGLVFQSSIVEPGAKLLNLETGESFVYPASIGNSWNPGRGRVVSSTGTAVFLSFDGKQLMLGSVTGAQGYDAVGVAQSAVIDDQATGVIYESGSAPGRTLRIIDLSSRSDRLLVGNAGDTYQPVMSGDGRRILFLSTGRFDSTNRTGLAQLFVVNRDGSGLRQLTGDASGIAEATLSGDGRVAWLVTFAGRLFRQDVETGAVSPAIGRSPSLNLPGGQDMGAGSMATLTGRGFSDASVSAESLPLPTALGGLRVRIGGVLAPLFTVSPSELLIQVPWELPKSISGDELRVEFDDPPDTPFEVGLQATLNLGSSPNPRFLRLGPEYPVASGVPFGSPQFVLAAHQNFEALVTRANPARPGEIIHVYMTGLGAVDRPVADGYSGPADPPAVVAGTPRCRVYDSIKLLETPDTKVYFAGLAPSLVGLYQVSLLVPESVSLPEMMLSCGITFVSPYTSQPVMASDYAPLAVQVAGSRPIQPQTRAASARAAARTRR